MTDLVPDPTTTDPTTDSGGAPVRTRALEPSTLRRDDLAETLRVVARRVAPVWPLDRFVAVNPYLGLADRTFADAAELLAATAGARSTLPVGWYLDAVDDGRITLDDLAAALETHHLPGVTDAEALLAEVRARGDEPEAWAARIPTVADVATATTGRDWARLATERISAWAAAHFDEGQAMWRSAARGAAPFASWKAEAAIDRTPEVLGLRGFRDGVRGLPDDAVAAAEQALSRLSVPAEGLELYLQRVLLRVGGWAAHAARLVWEAGQRGDATADPVVELLAIGLAWEVGLLETTGPHVAAAWAGAQRELGGGDAVAGDRRALVRHLVLQEAFDRAEQRRLVERFAGVASAPSDAPDPSARPDAQVVTCIDVRSEVLRRHLEAVAPGIDTLGFAGFFGVAVEVVPLAHERGGAQCPVLLTPSHVVAETVTGADPDAAVGARRLAHHVRRSWKSFKMGAVSCFSFVGPVGLAYLPKLLTDGAGRTRPVRPAAVEGLGRWADAPRGPSLDPVPGVAAGIPLADRIDLAEGALRGMSLTVGLSPLVVLTGHGATTVNNPYDSGLACGACGGHTGEANARVAAAVLNDPDVRAGLAARGVVVPADTWFLAAQHDTTTDRVELFDRHLVPADHRDRLTQLEQRLAEAGRRTRAERARRLGHADAAPSDEVDAEVLRRSTDWAQVRPEWGLAGCRELIAAPRRRTRDLDLEGRSFLHSYDWRRDEGFAVLELILTAPVVVASWINLQYYASTVEPRIFGSGNKVLHNVVGRLGVLEGNGGDLRTGLPWQSVHDGEGYQHEPIRLNVVVEAPLHAITDVLARHDGVRRLFDHGWIHLFALDDRGAVAHRYAGGLDWEPVAVGQRGSVVK